MAAGAAAAATDDGGLFFLKPQRGALLNKYSGSDGRKEAPGGLIIGRVERERCVKGGASGRWVAAEEGGVSGGGSYGILFYSALS